MRMSINIPDTLGSMVRSTAESEGRSMSSLIVESIEFHLKERKRNRSIQQVLALVGKTKVSKDIDKTLNEIRRDGRI